MSVNAESNPGWSPLRGSWEEAVLPWQEQAARAFHRTQLLGKPRQESSAMEGLPVPTKRQAAQPVRRGDGAESGSSGAEAWKSASVRNRQSDDSVWERGRILIF